MRFTGLLISTLVALNGLQLSAALAKAAATKSAGAKTSTCQLVFPAKYSLGTIYNSLAIDERGILYESGSVRHFPGSLVGEAQGKVTVPVHRFLYLIASYKLLEHPEVLTTLGPATFGSISFNRMGVMQPVEQVIEPLSHLTGLRRVELEMAELPDDLLKKLNTLTNLEALDLNQCAFRGTFIRDLSTLKDLRVLQMSDSKLVPDAFAAITQFHKLEVLNLGKTGINDSSLAQICKLEKLRKLYISNAKITPQGLRQLLQLRSKHLELLELTDTDLKAADLLCLAPLKIKTFYLPYAFTRSEMLMLHKAMPETNLLALRKPVDKETKTLFAPLRY